MNGVGEFVNKLAAGAASQENARFQDRDQVGCWGSLPREAAPPADLSTNLKFESLQFLDASAAKEISFSAHIAKLIGNMLRQGKTTQ